MPKAHRSTWCALMLLTSVACSKNPTESAEVKALAPDTAIDGKKTGSIHATLEALVPRLGGNLLALGNHWLELAIHENGLVEGLLYDKQGKLVDKPEATELAVKLKAQGDVEPVATLKWQAHSSRFVGQAEARPQAKSGVKAEAKGSAQADVKTDTKAEAQVDAKGSSPAQAEAQADAKGSSPAQAEATADTKLALVAAPITVDAKLDGKAETATLTEYALLPAPEFGGTVLGAGSYKAELIARPDGHLQAYVKDAAGAKLGAGAKAKLKARIGAKAARDLELVWHPGHACFVGKLASGAKLKGAPVSLALDAAGKTHLGGVAELPVTVQASPEAAVVIAGRFPVELTAKAGFVEARVFDASGKAHAAGDLDLKLFTGADARQALALSWHAPSACYRAKLGAKLDLFAEPIRLELLNRGQLHAGAAMSLKAAQSARLDADAKLGAHAKLAAKLPEVKAHGNLKSGADANLKAVADAKAKANAASNLGAKASVAVKKPTLEVKTPKLDVKKSASASADTNNKGAAKAEVKAGFSLGTK